MDKAKMYRIYFKRWVFFKILIINISSLKESKIIFKLERIRFIGKNHKPYNQHLIWMRHSFCIIILSIVFLCSYYVWYLYTEYCNFYKNLNIFDMASFRNRINLSFLFVGLIFLNLIGMTNSIRRMDNLINNGNF